MLKMEKQGTILVVDDNKAILTAVKLLLRSCFEKIITIHTPNLIKQSLQENAVDVILLDMNFSAGINNGNEGLYWLGEIKKSFSPQHIPRVPFCLLQRSPFFLPVL